MHHNKSMYITNVEKEGPFLKIWGQTDKKAALEIEEALRRASDRFEEGEFPINLNSLEVGTFCCAKYVDRKYYRARVTNISMVPDSMVEVNFLDYGNKDVIPINNLRTPGCFSSCFISLPPLSSPFILAEVVCTGGEWNDRILDQIAKDLKYIETNYVIVAEAIRFFFIKVFVNEVDLGLHLVRRSYMQNTSVHTQEAVLLAMIPRAPQPSTPPNQSLLQYKTFSLEPGSQHEVYVSFITDGPCHFSIQLKKAEASLAQLMREINSIPLKSLEELPLPGTVCLARCVDDNQICRAVVTSEVDSQYKLFYVDFGNTEVVPPENLYQIGFKYIIPKIMAIRLSLEGVEKSTMTIEMQCAFKQFVDNRLLMMEVLPTTKKLSLPKCRMWDPDTNTDVIEVLNRAAKCAYPDPIPLHKGFTQLVKVSFVYSCNRFYIQLKSKESELNKLMVDLQTYCNSNQTSYLDKPKVGLPCCALFSFDSQWYRSQITELNGELAKVRYIDYGNEEDVLVESLKVVEGEYLTVLRPQAIECCLNGYQNMAEDQDRDNKLEELILEQEFTMRVIEMINGRTLVDLTDAANTNVTVLLLEYIIAQSKIKSAGPPPPERFDAPPNLTIKKSDSLSQKPYFQHDDRNPTSTSDRKETQDDISWRQNTRKRSDSNSNESVESWRNENKGFKNRKENDWNDRPSNNNFRKDPDSRGRRDNTGGADRLQRPRDQNGDWGSKDESWNQNKSRKRDDKENSDWGKNSSRGPRNHGNAENDDWGNKNSSRSNDWNNKDSAQSDNWGDKNATNNDDWGEKKGFKDKNSGGGDWGGYKRNTEDRNSGRADRGGYKGNTEDRNSGADRGGYKGNREDRNLGGGDRGGYKGNTERKFGDRNRDNDRGGFKRKPNNRDGSEVGSSGSEKSFGKGFRTSSRNDSRPPRQDRKFEKTSDNSWNVSDVPSVIDSAPNDAIFKPIDVNGRTEKVTISWFHNPCNFFCQLIDSQDSFRTLMQDIQNAYKGRPAGNCVVGAPAVALFPEDNVLYRARIVEILGSRYKVHYVDFGNISEVDKVWPIENKFMVMPIQAIPCGLGEIKPIGDNWPNPDNFSEYFQKEDLDCTFSNMDNGKYIVSLFSGGQDIRQKLVDDSLAQYSQTSVIDFEIALFVGQQLHAMLQSMSNLSDFVMVLQSGIALTCSMHNLANATETNEEALKQLEGQILIVYVDDLVNDRLEVTLYDLTGAKLNIISPDEGAFDTVEAICPYLVTKSTIEGFVSHVNDTSVVIQPSDGASNLETLLEQMYEYYENLPPDNPLIPEEEFVYAVLSLDGNWYRGRVTSFDDDKATVVYIDYGNSEQVGFSRLRELTSDFTMWDALAILVNVQVPTAEFVDQDVVATVYYDESGWTGDLQIALPSDQPAITMNNLTEASLEFTEVSAEPSISTIPTTTDDCNTALNEESVSSGVEVDAAPSTGTSVVLSHIDSPSDFYIQLVDSLAAIDELQSKIQEQVADMAQLESASIGGLCAAPYSLDQQWYRSQILDADDDITTVRYIDFGNTDVIDNAATKIKTLPPELLCLEEYATRCRLKIKPNEEEWSKAATNRFAELTSVDNVKVAFVDQDEKTNYVELFSDGRNVKDVLIAENLALSDGTAPEGKLTGFISHMNSPSEFWMQLESCCGELEWIAEQLSSADSFPDLEDLTPGSLCAAMFSDDEMWYRARILSNTVAGLEVLFLDYGNSCMCSSLKQLPEHLVMAPPLAQKCSLQKPEALLNWSPEAALKFAEISADGQTIFVVKKLTTGETSTVELLVNGEDVASKLLPVTDNGYVTDIESLESFTLSKNGDAVDSTATGEKYSLEKIPGTEFNQDCVEKFIELNKEGNTRFDVEYLYDNTVRLYLDGCDIRNYFKDCLPIFTRETSPLPHEERSETALNVTPDAESESPIPLGEPVNISEQNNEIKENITSSEPEDYEKTLESGKRELEVEIHEQKYCNAAEEKVSCSNKSCEDKFETENSNIELVGDKTNDGTKIKEKEVLVQEEIAINKEIISEQENYEKTTTKSKSEIEIHEQKDCNAAEDKASCSNESFEDKFKTENSNIELVRDETNDGKKMKEEEVEVLVQKEIAINKEISNEQENYERTTRKSESEIEIHEQKDCNAAEERVSCSNESFEEKFESENSNIELVRDETNDGKQVKEEEVLVQKESAINNEISNEQEKSEKTLKSRKSELEHAQKDCNAVEEKISCSNETFEEKIETENSNIELVMDKTNEGKKEEEVFVQKESAVNKEISNEQENCEKTLKSRRELEIEVHEQKDYNAVEEKVSCLNESSEEKFETENINTDLIRDKICDETKLKEEEVSVQKEITIDKEFDKFEDTGASETKDTIEYKHDESNLNAQIDELNSSERHDEAGHDNLLEVKNDIKDIEGNIENTHEQSELEVSKQEKPNEIIFIENDKTCEKDILQEGATPNSGCDRLESSEPSTSSENDSPYCVISNIDIKNESPDLKHSEIQSETKPERCRNEKEGDSDLEENYNKKIHGCEVADGNLLDETIKSDEDSETRDILQSGSSVIQLKFSDDSSNKLEFNEEILASFPAPTVSENIVLTRPTKIVPAKHQGDS